jgi:hypothetical protein
MYYLIEVYPYSRSYLHECHPCSSLIIFVLLFTLVNRPVHLFLVVLFVNNSRFFCWHLKLSFLFIFIISCWSSCYDLSPYIIRWLNSSLLLDWCHCYRISIFKDYCLVLLRIGYCRMVSWWNGVSMLCGVTSLTFLVYQCEFLSYYCIGIIIIIIIIITIRQLLMLLILLFLLFLFSLAWNVIQNLWCREESLCNLRLGHHICCAIIQQFYCNYPRFNLSANCMSFLQYENIITNCKMESWF